MVPVLVDVVRWVPHGARLPAGERSQRVDAHQVHPHGRQSQNAWLHVYDIGPSGSAGFFDLGMTSLTYARRMTGSGGSVNAQWLHARSPSIQFSATPDPDGITHTWTGGAVLGAEINYGNSWADIGLVEDRRTSTYVGGLLMVADAVGAPYGGAIDKFHRRSASGSLRLLSTTSGVKPSTISACISKKTPSRPERLHDQGVGRIVDCVKSRPS